MKDFQAEDQILFEAIEAYKNGNGDKATIIYESTKKYTFKILHKGVERYKNQGALTSDVVSITEDIMQELYIEFFNKIANFRNEDPKSIFKWISVVAQRRLRTYVKENGTEVLQFEKDEDFREENAIWDSSEISDSDIESNHELLPEAALEDKEFRELILDFIQSLPEAQAQTVLLHFRGGMKYQEIADEMGVSLITVKTRMKKAKDSLEVIITKYEKKTGTKLHSVSILPLLWLLYRMASEDTTVPVAVDTAVTSLITGASSVTGASGIGIGSATTTAVTKAISTRVLVAIVSTAVAIGGVAVGNHFIGQKQETTIEQGDSEDKELDNKQDNVSDTPSKEDNETSNTNGEPTDSSTNQQNQDGGNNGDNTNEDNNVTQEGNGTENNTSGNASGNGNTSSNEGTSGSGDTSGNESTSESNTGNGNDSGNEDTSESTATKGTRANPYKLGEKIVVTDDVVENDSTSSGAVYNFEITVTDYTPIAELYAKAESENAMLYNIVKATVRITGEGENPGTRGPLILFLETNDGGMGYTGHLYTDEERESVIDVQTNTTYTIGVHLDKEYVTQDSVAQFLRITYYTADGQKHMLYVELE